MTHQRNFQSVLNKNLSPPVSFSVSVYMLPTQAVPEGLALPQPLSSLAPARCTFCLFVCFGLHLRHMEVPRPVGWAIESELHLPAYTTATAMPDPSHVCDLRHGSLS